MEYSGNSTALLESYPLLKNIIFSSINPHLVASLIIVLITKFVIEILRILNSIYEPIDYKLDLTTKQFCKSLAEIDNSFIPNYNDASEDKIECNQSKSLDCAINLPVDGSATGRSLDGSNKTKSTTTTTSASSLFSSEENPNHVYPNGWIPLIESFKVKANTIKSAIIFGRDVIITRSADGKQVSVLSAYCPHLGVHIGITGKVKEVNNESCVECPFHGWTFRSSDGQCVRIPYQKQVGSKPCNIPKQAKLKAWTCVEVDNFIYVWHHIDDQPPNWFYTPTKELEIGKKWHLAGRSCHKTNLELRDMLENGADMNHFEGIHNDLFILGGQITKIRPLNYLQEYTRHHWLPKWEAIRNEAGKMTHMAQMNLQSWVSFFKLRIFDITVHAIQIGPARVNLYYNSKWYGEGLLFMNAVPIGGRKTKYIQHIYTHKTLFQCIMAKLVLYGEIKMLERDFFIWNHKKNIKNPIFIPEDKTLKQFRLWYSQFYRRKPKIVIKDTENNDTVTDGKTNVINCSNSLDF